MADQLMFAMQLILICALFAAIIYLFIKSAVKSAIKAFLADKTNIAMLKEIIKTEADDSNKVDVN